MDSKLDQLWKDFGRETEAGKLLFSLYKVRNKPEVYYPPVKTKKKPLPFEETKTSSKTKAKPQIEYPNPTKPKMRKFHPIDFVPRRKNQTTIQDDINLHYRDVNPPAVKGTNRETMKNDLQEKFQFNKGKALPKQGMPAPSKFQPPKAIAPKVDKEEIPDSSEGLFDLIIKEIEERQTFLQDMQNMGQLTSEIEHRVKGEIAQRFGELQKLKELNSRSNANS